MHGILKVVQGTLTMSCYDKISRLSISERLIPSTLKSRADLIERGFVVPVRSIFSGAAVTPSSNPMVLSPLIGNFHEICNESDEPAAFVDILSPPYNHKGLELSEDGDAVVRECEYYKEVTFHSNDAEEDDKSIKWLKLIHTPSEFSCDIETYQGPKIEL